MIKIFDLVKKLTDRVMLEFGDIPSEGFYTYFIIRDKINNEIIELAQCTFNFKEKGRDYNGMDLGFKFIAEMQDLFASLRVAMHDHDREKPKWDEATLTLDKSGKVKMSYIYPDESDL